jgi:hypothetical protein
MQAFFETIFNNLSFYGVYICFSMLERRKIVLIAQIVAFRTLNYKKWRHRLFFMVSCNDCSVF